MRRLLTACLPGACLAALLAASGCDIAASMQLESAVKDALKNDSRTASSDFEVSAEADGTVTITGEVASAEERMAVTEIAGAVPGVTRVLNKCTLYEMGSGLMQDTVVPGVGSGLGL